MTPRRILSAAVILLLAIALGLPGMIEAQSPLDVKIKWKTYPIERRVPNAITVTVANKGAAPLQLLSVGLRFDWMKKDTYIVSEESKTPKNVTHYGGVSFDIGFQVADDVSLGKHEASLYLKYATFVNGTWGRKALVYIIPNVEIVGKSGFPLSTTTIAIIIIIVAILVLERKRIQAVIGKRIKREAEPSKPPEELE